MFYENGSNGSSILKAVKVKEGKANKAIDEKTYIKENADSKYVGLGDKLEKKDVLTVTTTVVDSNILPNASLDNLWADDDGDGMSDHADALRANAVSHAILYDLNEDSDYYVGYAGSRISGATLADWGASENNADAKMRDGFVFDDATGLIYVPKKYTEKNKKDELKVASSRIQPLLCNCRQGRREQHQRQDLRGRRGRGCRRERNRQGRYPRHRHEDRSRQGQGRPRVAERQLDRFRHRERHRVHPRYGHVVLR
ncbi:MAG: hypothetical protein ACLUBO_15240 [Coprococcus sp.]